MGWKRNVGRAAVCWLLATQSWANAAWNEPWYHAFGRWIGYGFGDGYHACPDATCGPCQARGSAPVDAWPTSGCPTCTQGSTQGFAPTPAQPVPAVSQRGLPGLDAPTRERGIVGPRPTAQRPSRTASPVWPTR